jgi:hypothetical protein
MGLMGAYETSEEKSTEKFFLELKIGLRAPWRVKMGKIRE